MRGMQVTDTNTNTAEGTSMPEQQGESEGRSGLKGRIAIAVIGALAGVAAATIPVLLNQPG